MAACVGGSAPPVSKADDLARAAIRVVCGDDAVPDINTLPEPQRILGDILISESEPLSERALGAVDAALDAAGATGIPALEPSPEALSDADWFSVGGTKLAVGPWLLPAGAPLHRQRAPPRRWAAAP